MSSRENIKRESKFTRGEKCIFAHLVVTFVLILALVLVYFAHLLRAPHSPAGALRVARRSRQPQAGPGGRARVSGDGRAAVVRAGGRRACAGVLLRARWAVAPAHCVAARAHPDLAHALPAWKISYRLQSDHYFDTDIIRGVVHSHFNRDDFSNNIGLFEQADPILMDEYTFHDTGVIEELVRRHAQEAILVVWEPIGEVPIGLVVHTMPSQRCREYVAPVAELRSYEFCVAANNVNLTVEHGSAVFFGSEVKGFVAWGDRNGNLPLVILDIGFYRKWIENVINMYL